MKKYFPINTETSCQLKWTWSTIMLYDGTTNSCHRVGRQNLTAENFKEFHNLPKKINDRRLMLEGQWPQGGCSEYCGSIEKAGGISDRQFQKQIPNLYPPELDNDVSAVAVTPRIVEVYFDNICNMSCIYCWDGFSSRIQQENKKFGPFKKGQLEIKNLSNRHPEFEEMSKQFWEWMTDNYQSVRRFHVLGGEPFFQPQFEKCLSFLEANNNPQLEFNIVTNLKLPLPKLKSYIDRIKKIIVERKIARLDITCSIDCWGEQQEYIRFGIDLEQWKRNFEFLVSQKWIYLNVNQTLVSLALSTAPQLIEYINKQRQTRPIGHYGMLCENPKFLHPGIFDGDYFDQAFQDIIDVMPADTWQQQEARKLMDGLRLKCREMPKDPDRLQQLSDYLDEMDRRRGTNWRKLFPEIEKGIMNVV